MSGESFTFPPSRRAEPDIPPIDERLTPAATAELIGVSVHTLRNWRSQRKGPAFYDVGKVFYTRPDIARWFANRRVNQR
jgi:hypothetical protein